MQIGEHIGPYEVLGLLGQGGMAEVYRARHTLLNRDEALKVVPAHMAHDKTFVARFLQEARTAAGLHHPHIATIYAVSDAGAPQPYFAMELVEDGDLDRLIAARRRLAWHEVVPLLQQMAAGLDYAHAHGVIHRDIKPANLLLENNGQGGWNVKVVDFGIARASEDAGGKRLTKTGMIVGTPDYMSPEQAGSGPPVDHRTDIYSLGVVAYEMLCGYTPFGTDPNASAFSIVMKHMQEPPRPPLEAVPGLPAAANNAILKALAKNPAERFASCSQFVAALAGQAYSAQPAAAQQAARQPVAQGGAYATQHMPAAGVGATVQGAVPQGPANVPPGTRVAPQPAVPPQPAMPSQPAMPQGGAQYGYGPQPGYGPQGGAPPGYGGQANVPPSYYPQSPPQAPRPARQPWMPVVAGIGLVAVVGFLGVGLIGLGPKPPPPLPTPSVDVNNTSSASTDAHSADSTSDNSAASDSEDDRDTDDHASGVTTPDPVETPAITPIATPPVPIPTPAPRRTSPPASPGSSNDAWPGERYPETRRRVLAAAEVGNWSYAKVRYALNEMYARHGYRFQTPAIRQQFAQFSWYRPSNSSQETVEAQFNSFERANKILLAQMRDAKKGGGE